MVRGLQKYDCYSDTCLLAQTDTRTCVKWKEYERVGCKVFVQTIVEESVRVEF